MARTWVIVMTMVLAPGCTPACGEWTTLLYGDHAFVASSETLFASESSGVVASRTNPCVYWTHNDAGAAQPLVWAFRLAPEDKAARIAKHLGRVELTGASNHDWEDIASGPDGTIYLFDGGDNPPCERSGKQIHRFTEPTIDPAGSPITMTCPFDSLRFEYPSSSNPSLPAETDTDRYDAECLMVHPTTGDIYIVTKRTTDKRDIALVFKLPAASIAWNSSKNHVLQYLADLTPKVSSIFTAMVTGGDIHADGGRLIIRTYAFAYEFVLPPNQPFDAIFQQTPETLSLLSELVPEPLQGEAICYGYCDGSLITTTEASGQSVFRIFATSWLMANLRAEAITNTTARICWETPQPSDSSVDYGTTTTYGSTLTDPSPRTDHALTLTGLATDQTYFYRARSDSLTYPAAPQANAYTFRARLLVRPDFDHDGDVDLDDFAHLQRCLEGPAVIPQDPDCNDARLDGDDDVDAADRLLLQDCLSGTNIPPEPNCLDK
ncbi:MAG TPA: hypothetical protein PKY77_05100 [Phycisphaerae bacterium]|nr:hypothetical protein [Phycisphaerae bacterium]HRY68891.1 hypothetical protein [Phycisphaerae bacterium]HSA25718.1 hypothetical protein [Phycisphaerae bacterium]